MKTQIPLSYFQVCKIELESTLQKLEEGIEKEYYFAQLFYMDEVESNNLPFNFIIPIPSSLITFYRDTLGKIISVYPIRVSPSDLTTFIIDSQNWINSILNTEIYDFFTLENVNKKRTMILKNFKRGELKTKCIELAQKYKLVKGQTLPGSKIKLIINDLENMGYKVSSDSVATELREKLKFKKVKY